MREPLTNNFGRRTFTSLAALAALGVLAFDSTALAADANMEVLILRASNGAAPGSIDPHVDDGLPSPKNDQDRQAMPSVRLKQPPFSAYNTYQVRDRKSVGLDKGKPSTLALPNGRTLQITLKDVTVDGGQKRYKVSATISEPNGRSFLPLLDVTASVNRPFFVGGQSWDAGASMVLAFTIKG